MEFFLSSLLLSLLYGGYVRQVTEFIQHTQTHLTIEHPTNSVKALHFFFCSIFNRFFIITGSELHANRIELNHLIFFTPLYTAPKQKGSVRFTFMHIFLLINFEMN